MTMLWRRRRREDDDEEQRSPLLKGDEASADTELRSSISTFATCTRRYIQAGILLGGNAITAYLWRWHFELTSIPLFAGTAFVFTLWMITLWFDLAVALRTGNISKTQLMVRSRAVRIFFGLASLLAGWIIFLSLSSIPIIEVPPLNSKDRYFIAANLYNCEAIMPQWTSELELLIEHLGRDRVYVSIYESNSRDDTRTHLHSLEDRMETRGIPHRIITSPDDGRQPFGLNSRQRIAYLSSIRNKVLEPLQSSDENIRLPDWLSFDKIVFLNDVVYRWQDTARLIGTKQEPDDDVDYDMACAVDHAGSGFYDSWTSRDICGTPLRREWPYVRDPISRSRMRKEVPFRVATCWNGAVVLRAEPFLYRPTDNIEPVTKLDLVAPPEWAMIDNSSHPDSAISPALNSPLRFRTSGIDSCNHSECFLLPYDFHRLYRHVPGRPKILLNPKVKLAYDKKAYEWWNFVCRIPLI